MSSRKRLLFRLLTVVAALGTIEVGARIVFAVREEPPPTANESLEHEWEWARKHVAAGKALLESDLVFHPVLGWALRPDLPGPDVTSSSEGLRGRDEVPVARQATERRIVFVGDSYTFGHGNKDEETYPHHLGALLPGWRTLNYGVPGYGTDQSVLNYERRGSRYGAEIAVLGFFVRDYSRNVLSFRDYQKPVFVPDGGSFRLEGPPIPPPEQLYDEYASGRRRIGAGVHSYAWGALGRSLRRLAARRVDETTDGTRVLWYLMDRFHASANAAGATPVWLIIPDEDAVNDRESRWAEVERLAEKHATEIGLRCVNVAIAFREAMQKSPQVRIYKSKQEGGHLSSAGNQVIAEVLRRCLNEWKLLEP